MNRKLWALALMLAVPVSASAQSLKLPATKSTPPNIPVIVGPTDVVGGTIKWMLPDPGVEEILLTELFPATIADQATGRIFFARQPGRYRIWAVCAKADKVSDKAECVLVVGDAPPPVPPGPNPPGPVPPGPTPPTPGTGLIPGDGLRVLIVYDRPTINTLTKDQLAVIYGATVRDYLNANCAKGADGKTAEWRIWAKTESVQNEAANWQTAFARPRTATPWIIVSNPQRGGGYEGPLPANEADALTLLKKFGG